MRSAAKKLTLYSGTGAAFFHVAAAMIEGVQLLVLTGEELAALVHAEDLVPLFRRKHLGMTRQQIRAAKDVGDRQNQPDSEVLEGPPVA
jgi:hypothetical protein